jgi:hypothetical protein
VEWNEFFREVYTYLTIYLAKKKHIYLKTQGFPIKRYTLPTQNESLLIHVQADLV